MYDSPLAVFPPPSRFSRNQSARQSGDAQQVQGVVTGDAEEPARGGKRRSVVACQ